MGIFRRRPRTADRPRDRIVPRDELRQFAVTGTDLRARSWSEFATALTPDCVVWLEHDWHDDPAARAGITRLVAYRRPGPGEVSDHHGVRVAAFELAIG